MRPQCPDGLPPPALQRHALRAQSWHANTAPVQTPLPTFPLLATCPAARHAPLPGPCAATNHLPPLLPADLQRPPLCRPADLLVVRILDTAIVPRKPIPPSCGTFPHTGPLACTVSLQSLLPERQCPASAKSLGVPLVRSGPQLLHRFLNRCVVDRLTSSQSCHCSLQTSQLLRHRLPDFLKPFRNFNDHFRHHSSSPRSTLPQLGIPDYRPFVQH